MKNKLVFKNIKSKFYHKLINNEAVFEKNSINRYDDSKSKYQTDNKLKSVVLLEYPRKGVWAVGFATKENSGIIKEKVKEELINVFVPTTPNPTSGFLLMIPKKDLIYLDVTFEQASKFIVSAGTTNLN